MDISNIPIDNQAMQNGLVPALSSMANVEELSLSECFQESRRDITFEQNTKGMIEQMFRGCRMLKSLDVSRNFLSKDNLNCIFKCMRQQGANTIESLSLSQVNLQKDSQLVAAVQEMRQLKKLNISNNEMIGGQAMQ